MKAKNHSAALLLGGNIGNTRQLFVEAITLLEEEVKTMGRSSLYSTAAWGMPQGIPGFLNQVVLVDTPLPPEKILSLATRIEEELGRHRSNAEEGYQSRSIDIDLLFVDDLIENTETLSLPHPRLHLRGFTLVPLLEVAPHWQHPLLKKTVRQLLDECKDPLSVTKL